jgi:putative membrane-bound dehydrogenase-like protein
MNATCVSLTLLLSFSLLAAEPETFELKPAGHGLLAPEDLSIELLGQEPLINNPAAMCVAPDGRIFVCEDYGHARVPGITRDVVKVLVGPETGGVATSAITVAEDLNSVQGLAFFNGVLYIAHSPRISTVKISADNKAGPVEDLFVGVGLDRPFKPSHGASGISVHDGKIYFGFGDQGCDFTDHEGRRVFLDCGAILRCDPDGSHVEIFAHGFRNVYGIAMDPMGNIFVRDNTNDGGGYNVRSYHAVKGSYFGWPFRWRDGEREKPPIDVLTKSYDRGGGSPCGAVWLRGSKWPAKYNNAALLCEWGRARLLFMRPVPTGATFDLPEQPWITDAREPGATHEFRPTTVALAPDQSVLVADWGTGPLYPTSKKGRLFRVTYKGALQPPAPSIDDLVAALNNETATELLLQKLEDGQSLERARAAYLLGERKYDAASGKLAALLNDNDAVVRLHAAIALGDMKDAKNLPALTAAVATEKERWIRQNLLRGIRQSGTASDIATAIDAAPPANQPDLLFALRDIYDEAVADALLHFGKSGKTSDVRATATEFLGLVAKREEKRWAWGDKPNIQPAPRDQNWAATERIVAFLREAIRDNDAALRAAALAALQQIKDTGVVDTVLAALKDGSSKLDDATAEILAHSAGNQKAAAALAEYLRRPAGVLETRIEIANQFGLWKDAESLEALREIAFAQGNTKENALRVAALDSLARRDDAASIARIIALLKDGDAELQRAAARALGQLGAKEAVAELAKTASSADRSLKTQALIALWRIDANGGTDAFLRGVAALPAADDGLQVEILEAIGATDKKRLEPALLVWAEFGSPGNKTETQMIGFFEKWAKSNFGLNAKDAGKRAGAAAKIAEYRTKSFPKFKLPDGLKAAVKAAPGEDEDARWERLFQAAPASKGDAARGANVFRDLRGANCISCHLIGAEGRRIGPELTEVAAKYTRVQLAESVLYPSKQLLDGYEQNIVTLKSGERLNGIVMSEDAEKLSLAKSDGSTASIPLSEIGKRVKSKSSLMPDGLVNALSDQDFFDLLAYLETLKK